MIIRELKKIEFVDITSLLLLLIAFLPSLVVKRRKKNIWLLCERVKIADDNAWIFYHWLRQNHPEIPAYFVLHKDAPNFKSDDRHMLRWGSLRHYIYYLASMTYIMATFNTPAPNGRVFQYYNSIFRRKYDKVYLKHGVTLSGMEEHRYELHHFKLYLCGAKPEYDFVLKEGGYPPENVKYTGFARFDELLENKCDKRFILLIPTWRKYIGCDHSLSNSENELVFKESDYYKRYSSILRNPILIDFLERTQLKLRFCLHAEFRKFEKFFSSTSKWVEIVPLSESIHELLYSNSLLITDYSSVAFDSAYVEKPIIYYHFDYNSFRSKHLSEGYFDFERDGFGPIVNNEKELIELIIKEWDGQTFVMPEEYKLRKNMFFTYHDAHNCERIYSEIKKLM